MVPATNLRDVLVSLLGTVTRWAWGELMMYFDCPMEFNNNQIITKANLISSPGTVELLEELVYLSSASTEHHTQAIVSCFLKLAKLKVPQPAEIGRLRANLSD